MKCKARPCTMVRLVAVAAAFFLAVRPVLSLDGGPERWCEAGSECFVEPQDRPGQGHPSLIASNGDYNVWNCPPIPPPGYPDQWKAVDVLHNWHPDNLTLPSYIHQGICVFDFFQDFIKATNYLEFDVPFVVRGTPDFQRVAERWSQTGYINDLLQDATYPLYTSKSNQFLYWDRNKSPPPGWEPPTEYSRVSYPQFQNLLSEAAPNESHHYLYAEGHWSASDENFRWPLFEEFPRFKPGNTDLFHELFHQEYQTLYCKFAMAGNTAVLHFDQNRNTIVMVKGQRRYLLADPTQCTNFHLREKSHPSNRHTRLDLRKFPKDNAALMNEVILQPGDALILPSFWFHSVIGLTAENIQCSAWSTATTLRKPIIQACGDFM